jgi:hypothetical protein
MSNDNPRIALPAESSRRSTLTPGQGVDQGSSGLSFRWVPLALAAAELKTPYPILYQAMIRGEYPCERRGNRWFIGLPDEPIPVAPVTQKGGAR